MPVGGSSRRTGARMGSVAWNRKAERRLRPLGVDPGEQHPAEDQHGQREDEQLEEIAKHEWHRPSIARARAPHGPDVRSWRVRVATDPGDPVAARLARASYPRPSATGGPIPARDRPDPDHPAARCPRGWPSRTAGGRSFGRATSWRSASSPLIVGSAAIATDTLRAGYYFGRVVARAELFLNPPPDRDTAATVASTPRPRGVARRGPTDRGPVRGQRGAAASPGRGGDRPAGRRPAASRGCRRASSRPARHGVAAPTREARPTRPRPRPSANP